MQKQSNTKNGVRHHDGTKKSSKLVDPECLCVVYLVISPSASDNLLYLISKYLSNDNGNTIYRVQMK